VVNGSIFINLTIKIKLGCGNLLPYICADTMVIITYLAVTSISTNDLWKTDDKYRNRG
jgi:hypothetical protein